MERDALTKTFQMEASDAWDSGRAAMRYTMQMKEARRAERAKMPMADRPSSGPIACIDG